MRPAMPTKNRWHTGSTGSPPVSSIDRYRGPPIGMAHEEHGHLGASQHLLGDRAEEQPTETAAPVRAHGDQIRVGGARGGQNLLLGRSDADGPRRLDATRAQASGDWCQILGRVTPPIVESL